MGLIKSNPDTSVIELDLNNNALMIDDDVGLIEQGGEDIYMKVLLAIGEALAVSGDKPTFSEAIKGDEKEEWKKVIDDELTQMERVKA